MATRTWTNGSGLAISAANLNSLEADLSAKADGNHTHAAATSGAAGFMSPADKAKLDSLVAAYTFEDGTSTGVIQQNGTVEVVTPEAHSGSYAISLTAISTTVDAVAIFPGFPVQEGRTYRLSAWIKQGSGTGHTLRFSGTMTKPDNTTVFISTQPSPTLNNTTYTKVSYDWTIPAIGVGVPGYKFLTPRLSSANARVVGYQFFIDDVTFTDVTDAVTLATATSTGAISGSDRTRLDNALTFAANMPTGQDLNLLTTSGNWNVQSSSTWAGSANWPVLAVGLLTVIARSGNDTVTQRFKTHLLGTVYERSLYGGVWYPWVKLSAEIMVNVKDFGAVGDGVANDGGTIQNAVNAAAAQGRTLYWPAGTYLKTGNITNFHTVKHIGPGAILHGTDTFYVQPSGIQANTIYVSTVSASDTNDGLSSAFPFRKIGAAINALANYGPVLQGFWAVQMSAGTWSDRTVVPTNIDSISPITVRGPIVNHPNVPTAIISEGYNIGAVGIKVEDVKASFIFSNILFSGYNGTTSSAGIQVSDVLQETFTINCHFTDCYWGLSSQSSKADMKGGIHQRCGYLGDTANNVAKSSRNGNGGGYRGLMAARHSIGLQNAGVLTNGPYFYNCVSAIFVQENCTGHIDFASIEDCVYGINLNVNSRANADGTSFKRNTIDLRGIGNSHFYLTTNNVFGTGADESSSKIVLSSGSQCVDDNRIFTNISQSYSTSLKYADTKFPAQTVTATAATTVYTATLAAMVWRDAPSSAVAPKRVIVKVYGELLGTAGTKTVTVRFGTSAVSAIFTSAEVGVFEMEGTVFFTGTATQFMTLRAYRHIGTGGRLASAQATNAMTAATGLTVEASIGTAPDSVRIDAVDMSWG